MNLREIKEELLRAATLVEDFEKNHLEIDRDAALNKMRQAYEALRFITPHTVIEEPAVEPLVPFTPDEESEPEVEVEFIMPEDDDEPTEEILPIAEPTEPATEEATEEEEQTEEEVVYVAEDDEEVAETEAEPVTEPIAEPVVEAEPEPTPEPVAEEEPTAEAEDDFDIDEAFEPEEEPEPTIEPVVEAEPEPEAEPKRVVVEPSLFGDYEPIVKRSTPSRRKIMALYEDEPTPAPTPKAEPKTEPVVEPEPTPTPAPAPIAEPKVEPIVDGENKVLGEVITPTTTIADTIAPVVSVAEDRPVDTLRSAISVVDRFMLIRDLFDDDDQLYEQTIDELEKMDNLDDCIIYIAENFAWRPSSEGAKLMMDLLQRKLG